MNEFVAMFSVSLQYILRVLVIKSTQYLIISSCVTKSFVRSLLIDCVTLDASILSAIFFTLLYPDQGPKFIFKNQGKI